MHVLFFQPQGVEDLRQGVTPLAIPACLEKDVQGTWSHCKDAMK